ncbi:Nuclear speckle splicing regulatory protein 1-like protein [Drosera capensis]
MESKKYGLQIRVPPSQHQRKPPPRPPKPITFDDDDDDVEREISRQASKNKSLRDIEDQHKKALEEDPSVFDYDGVYDEMKVNAVKPRVEDRQERKPKYIQALMEKAKQREREHEIVYDRKLAKERSKEDHLYADKDKFVTSAYKRKLAEQAKWLEEERLRELREEKDEVSKKSDISDFYFNLSKNVAFGATSTKLQTEKKPEREPVPSPSARSHSPAASPGTSPSRSQERSHNEEASRVQVDTSLKQVEGRPATSVPSSKETEKPVEPTSSEQPKSDHKKTEDALAAAKERFLARKRAKQQD